MSDMRIFGSVDDMKQARRQLGHPAALNEALVATGIDALFVLLDGGSVEIDGVVRRLVPLPVVASVEAIEAAADVLIARQFAGVPPNVLDEIVATYSDKTPFIEDATFALAAVWGVLVGEDTP